MAQTSFPLEVGGFHPSPRPDFWPVPSARAPHGPAIPVPSIPQTCPFPSSGRPPGLSCLASPGRVSASPHPLLRPAAPSFV